MSKLKALFGQRTMALFLLVMALLAVQGCRSDTSSLASTASPAPATTSRPEPTRAPTLRAEVPVSKTPAPPPLTFTGEVRAKDQVTLSAKASGRIAEARVAVGDQVKKKDLLVVLEHEAMDAQVKQAEATLKAAEATLKGAQAQLDLLQAGATKEQIAVAEATIKAAEANMALALVGSTKEQIGAAEAVLATAQAKLDIFLAGPKAEELKIAEYKIEMARQDAAVTYVQTSLYPPSSGFGRIDVYMRLGELERESALMDVEKAKQDLELLKAPPKAGEVAQLKGAIDESRAKLEALKTPPRSQQVAQLQAAVDIAKAQLEALKALARPYDVSRLEAAVEGARAQVTFAQASLSLATANREEAFLYSPVDGVVISRALGVGSLASAGASILTIAYKEVEVVIAVVPEIALGQVSPRQAVSITASPYPDQIFSGSVRAIAPGASSTTRTFDVYIDPQDSKGLLRPGVFVSVALLRSGGP